MIELHVIIDIDQTLIDSMTKDIYDENRDKIRKPDFTNNNQYVWVRPKVKEFFNYLDKNVKYRKHPVNDKWIPQFLVKEEC